MISTIINAIRWILRLIAAVVTVGQTEREIDLLKQHINDWQQEAVQWKRSALQTFAGIESFKSTAGDLWDKLGIELSRTQDASVKDMIAKIFHQSRQQQQTSDTPDE